MSEPLHASFDHPSMCTHLNACMHECMYVCMNVRMYVLHICIVYVHRCVYLCMHALCMYVRMYACVYLSVCIEVCTYLYMLILGRGYVCSWLSEVSMSSYNTPRNTNGIFRTVVKGAIFYWSSVGLGDAMGMQSERGKSEGSRKTGQQEEANRSNITLSSGIYHQPPTGYCEGFI